MKSFIFLTVLYLLTFWLANASRLRGPILLETGAEESPGGDQVLQFSDDELADLNEQTPESCRIKEVWKKMGVESADAKV